MPPAMRNPQSRARPWLATCSRHCPHLPRPSRQQSQLRLSKFRGRNQSCRLSLRDWSRSDRDQGPFKCACLRACVCACGGDCMSSRSFSFLFYFSCLFAKLLSLFDRLSILCIFIHFDSISPFCDAARSCFSESVFILPSSASILNLASCFLFLFLIFSIGSCHSTSRTINI